MVGLSFVSLLVNDPHRSAQFYVDLFELPIRDDLTSDHFVGLQVGSTILGFSGPAAYQLLNLPIPDDRIVATTFTTFEVDEKERVGILSDRATGLGGVVVKEPAATYYNAWQSVVRDPDGHVLRINYLPDLAASLAADSPVSPAVEPSRRQVVRTAAAAQPVSSYNQAVRRGSTLYVSGFLGVNPETGDLVADSDEAEIRQTLDNLKAVIEAAGLRMADVVKTTVFVTRFDLYRTFDAIYAEYFAEPYPARSTVRVADLLLGSSIEVEAIAVAAS